jgi:hypothetical protein
MDDKEVKAIKRHDAQYIFFYLNKDMNSLNDGDKLTKKNSIQNIYSYIVMEKPQFNPEVIQEILITFNKPLIKISFFDDIDKCREYALKILIL